MNAARLTTIRYQIEVHAVLINRFRQMVAGFIASVALVAGLSTAPSAHAQSDASLLLSALPVASVVVAGTVSVGASTALITLPVVLSVDGARLVVKGVQSSAKGTVLLLEGVSTAGAASVEFTAGALSAAAASVGTTVLVSVVGAGVLLSAAGEVIAFIPNEVGKALLYNERM